MTKNKLLIIVSLVCISIFVTTLLFNKTEVNANTTTDELTNQNNLNNLKLDNNEDKDDLLVDIPAKPISEEIEIEKTNNKETDNVKTTVESNPPTEYPEPTDSPINDILILANKAYSLSSNYKPQDLVVPNVRFIFEGYHEKQNMRQVSGQALEELFAAADKEGVHLYAVSGYRSYATQQSVNSGHVQRLGQVEADKVSARPGHSEHQTGLAMDVTSQSANFALSQEFGATKEGIWLAENAHKYGFIIRYEKGKEHLTGYSYEPWHIRYVGTNVATEIYEKDLTLEQYLSA